MKKGITPIIAIIILLLITVAIAGVAWSFFQGYLYTMMSGSFDIPIGGAYCTDGTIIVQIMNTGQANLTDSDITISRIADSLQPRPFSSREFIIEMGAFLNENAVNRKSVVLAAYKKGVPIFCPAFSTGSRGEGWCST